MKPPKDIKEHLRYDSTTGYLWWIKPGLARQLHRLAGTYNRDYPSVRFRWKIYYVHHVAWFLKTGKYPVQEVDHKDGNPRNNKWNNLRMATRSQQLQNARKSSANTSGHKGVVWSKEKQKWVAQIKHHRKTKHLGYHSEIKKACAAYAAAARKQFGEFARVH